MVLLPILEWFRYHLSHARIYPTVVASGDCRPVCANRSGRGWVLERWVLVTALAQARCWHPEGWPYCLYSADFHRPSQPPTVTEAEPFTATLNSADDCNGANSHPTRVDRVGHEIEASKLSRHDSSHAEGLSTLGRGH